MEMINYPNYSPVGGRDLEKTLCASLESFSTLVFNY